MISHVLFLLVTTTSYHPLKCRKRFSFGSLNLEPKAGGIGKNLDKLMHVQMDLDSLRLSNNNNTILGEGRPNL